jgi:single-stranded DNA-specific DHH superfamily exonuclease
MKGMDRLRRKNGGHAAAAPRSIVRNGVENQERRSEGGAREEECEEQFCDEARIAAGATLPKATKGTENLIAETAGVTPRCAT